MIKWFKRHFIPHKDNNHRPHFLHRKNAIQLVGIILFFELILFILPALNFSGFINSLNLSSVLPGVLTSLSNEERIINNLPPLQESQVLSRAAQLKAEDMASKSYFAHTSPEGITPWYWLDVVGYQYSYAGENLAVNFMDSKDVTKAWMNSPTHKANIVHGAYTEVGTGVAVGMYKGREAVFVAQVYARPPVVFPSATNPSISLDMRREFSVEVPSNEAEEVLGDSQSGTTLPSRGSGVNRVVQDTVREMAETAATSPRQTTNVVLYSVFGIITLAILFNIFIKIKHQHSDLIFNGAVVMAIILALHITNSYVSTGYMTETSFISLDYQVAPLE